MSTEQKSPPDQLALAAPTEQSQPALSAPPDQPALEEPAPAAVGPLVVGLGASAGGLEALEEFFQRMSPDSGLAFVVVTHQLPGRVSMMPDLLSRVTAMPVTQVSQPARVQRDHVYLAPPGANLDILHGTLHVSEPLESHHRNLPVDHFFRSLAMDQRERAIGIVLSGTGSDGSNGLKEIKGASGLAMAQEEATARYPGMPHSAIGATQVDFVLAPRDMPARLLAYARGAIRRVRPGAEVETEAPDLFHQVFLLLRSRTGHDFSHYKSTTIRRRIERRMNVHQIDTLKDYLRFLQTTPSELDRLFKELLIGVTSFFRDPEAFEILAASVMPEILTGKPDDYLVRAWVPGCSTGEEAYSIAMLFRETMESLKRRLSVQVFATDLDQDAIDAARAGLYPDSIAADVSPRRLERFFLREDGFYRIKKDVREMVVFAQQNLIEDPPFTKLDILSCRNLLIYLDNILQKRLIPIFHYALRSGGVLFLGSSETVGSFGHLFDSVDRKWKIFRRRDVSAGTYVADLPSALPADLHTRDAAVLPNVRKGTEMGLGPLAERAFLQHLVPPTVLMHERGEIVHIHGRTGAYLEPAQGPQSQANIYNMARAGLELELAVAVRHASMVTGDVIHRGVRVRTNGDSVSVDLRVKRLSAPEPLAGLYLVAFERPEPIHSDAKGGDPAAPGAQQDVGERVAELERELQHAKEVHQSTIEELETANEELKSTNEELQSTNEELQSANEELETSKEEMQSLNEELQTVNAELQGKVEELSRANDDMKNLLNATDIATLFLDNELNIKRYTDQARRVIRLIPSDVGRPISDLVFMLHYTRLVEDAREVLRTLVFKESEVQGEDGAWYLMRIMPYRTTDNVIDGLVVTCVDITKVKDLQEETRRLVSTLRSSPMSLFEQDAELRYKWVCAGLFGRRPEEVVGLTDQDLLPPAEAGALTALKRQVLEHGEPLRQAFTLPASASGRNRTYYISMESQRDGRGAITGISGVVTLIQDMGGSSPWQTPAVDKI